MIAPNDAVGSLWLLAAFGAGLVILGVVLVVLSRKNRG